MMQTMDNDTDYNAVTQATGDNADDNNAAVDIKAVTKMTR
jgi:hypothetical protein